MKIIDDFGRIINLNKKPKRLISLCPSLTETLFELELGDLVVGCTDYCISPADKLKHVQKVGGPKTFSVEQIANLNPDLILTVKEENSKNLIKELINLGLNCIIFDINSLDDALNMIKSLGIWFDKIKLTNKICEDINFKLTNIKLPSLHFIYMVWNLPYIVVGTNNYINSLLTNIGFINCLSNQIERYVKLKLSELKNFNPDIIFLPSEPYNYTINDKLRFAKHFPNSKIMLVDGEMFCWYGTRILRAIDYITNLF